MHPTADTQAVIYLQRRGAARDARRSAARVIEIHAGDLPVTTARGSVSIRRSPFTRGPRFPITLRGAPREVRRFEYRWSRQVCNSPTAPPNNGMHPTADTTPVIYSQGRGAAG